MTHQRIQTDGAPAAIGPYSQAISTGELLFCAGQVGLDPATGQLVDGFEAQVERALDNVGAVLAAAGMGFGDVVKSTCFLIDLADFQAFNEHYGRRFGEPGAGALDGRGGRPAAGRPRGDRGRGSPGGSGRRRRARLTPRRAGSKMPLTPMPTPPPAGAAARLAAWSSGT